MKLVEFTSARSPHGPVFINPEQVVFVVRRFKGGGSTNELTTETTIGMVGDDGACWDVIGAMENVASRLAVTISKVGHPERVNDGTEGVGS